MGKHEAPPDVSDRSGRDVRP